jgi:hypothetical protein
MIDGPAGERQHRVEQGEAEIGERVLHPSRDARIRGAGDQTIAFEGADR